MTATKTMNNQKSRGFTLIELLTVMIIISILAIISLGVQRASVQSARAARTRTTIMKIDTVLSGLYEKYQYRKVDVDDCLNATTEAQKDAQLFAWTKVSVSDDQSRGKARQILRTLMLRDQLRMDMPTSVAEVNALPLMFTERTARILNNNDREKFRSALNQSYQAITGLNLNTTNAELLYLVVTNGDPETRTMFHDREIGDVNENGLNEFLDGWGNPICFLRWAPGLVGSSRQAPLSVGQTIQAVKLFHLANDDINNLTTDQISAFKTALRNYLGLPLDDTTELTALVTQAEGEERFFADKERYADPLDPLDLCDGWLLVPMVFSWGPDGEAVMPDPVVCINPFVYEFKNLGADDSTGASQDNITNHNYYNE